MGCWLLAAFFALASITFAASTKTLTFEERVAAEEAIERVYYAHQIGATKPFEEAIPRQVLEDKVTKYLKQSVALEKHWKNPITAEMLRAERDGNGPGRAYRIGYTATDCFRKAVEGYTDVLVPKNQSDATEP
jgi:hypothetical protein